LSFTAFPASEGEERAIVAAAIAGWAGAVKIFFELWV
jgi:hypothetical protein